MLSNSYIDFIVWPIPPCVQKILSYMIAPRGIF